MLEVFHAAGFRQESRSIEYGVVHLAFDIEPTGESLAASERRAWTAGVQSIARVLRPQSIAVIGAGRNPIGIGHSVVRNLIDGGFKGSVYPVNPNVDTLLGLACAPTVEAIEGPVDLAVLAIPAAQCIEAVDACARKAVKGLVVISSGFAEVGAEGAALQRELLLRAHRGGMRVVGPNCFGVINTAPDVSMNATFASRAPIHGGLAFASQSGALGIAILEQSLTSGLGLSSFVSMGNKCDVSSNDLLRYWQQDGETRAILLYLESFGNPRAFARVAPVVSRTTPIVVVKSGRSSAGTRAAASHTAALASPDTVVDALFHQAGVIRVDTLEELLDCGQLLANQPALAGNRLAIVGNAGGAAVLAADTCEAAGLSVPEFDAATQAALRELAGPNAGVSNPVDLGAGATPKLFEDALRTVLAVAIHRRRRRHSRSGRNRGSGRGRRRDRSAWTRACARSSSCISATTKPRPRSRRGSGRSRATHSRSALCERWGASPVTPAGRTVPSVRFLFWTVSMPALHTPSSSNISPPTRTADGCHPAKPLRCCAAFGIATAGEVSVSSASEAAAAATQLGYPVALKAVGATILHKSDVGGVRLDLATPDDVAAAFTSMSTALGDAMEGAIVQSMHSGVELIAGVVSDPLFGPVVMFGSGGTAVELFGDRVLRILPLTDQDAHEMVRSIRGAPLLFGHRGAPPCDVDAVEDVLLRVARFADEVPQLAEMDLNPLIASPSGAVAVDVRIRSGALAAARGNRGPPPALRQARLATWRAPRRCAPDGSGRLERQLFERFAYAGQSFWGPVDIRIRLEEGVGDARRGQARERPLGSLPCAEWPRLEPPRRNVRSGERHDDQPAECGASQCRDRFERGVELGSEAIAE